LKIEVQPSQTIGLESVRFVNVHYIASSATWKG